MRKLFDQRLQSSMIQVTRYGRYILNDHIKFVLLFVIALGAYYYSEWLQTLPANVPVFLITSLIMAFVIVFGRVITMLERADEVYLLPLEKQMKSYFEKCVSVTFFIHLLPLLFVAIVSIPFLMHSGWGNKTEVIGYIALLLVLKNTQLRFRLIELYSVSEFKGNLSLIVRYILLVWILYFYLVSEWLYLSLLLAVWFGLLFFFIRKKETSLFLWFDAISFDSDRWSKFYRFAQMFADVPNLPAKIKRRQYGSWFYSKKKKTPFVLLYERAFIRGQGFAPMVVRLCLIGLFAIYLLPYEFSTIVVGTIAYYLIGYQLLPLYRSFDYVPWTNIYPFSNADKIESFRNLFVKVSLVIWGVFAVGGVILQTGLTNKMYAVLGISVTFTLLWKFYFTARIKSLDK